MSPFLAHFVVLAASTGERVYEFVRALQRLLARFETRAATPDRTDVAISIELRTSLAVLTTELEVMLERPRADADWESSARLCLDEVRRLTTLVNTLHGA